jgi:GNAT superfamily N-acetyltransferase
VDRARLLALMDASMRAMYRADTEGTPGGTVVETDGVLLCTTPRGTAISNMAIVRGPVDARTVRERTAGLYERAGRPYTVWTRVHADDALEPGLRALGFRPLVDLPAMAFLPGGGAPAAPPPEITVRSVTDDAGREAYAGVMARAYAVYGIPEESTAEHFATIANVVGPATRAFLAYKRGRAVAGALLFFADGVGAVNWVGTLPEEFRQGYGAAVTWAAVTEGLRRGACLVNLQASTMGAPVYRRMGFTTPTHYRVLGAPA